MVPTAGCTEEDWDQTVDIDLNGVWLCMKYEILEMLKQGGGAIVNNASAAGVVGFQMHAAYCASKGGVVQLTRTAALEYARSGIRVNVVCPGPIRTEMAEETVRLLTNGVEAQFIGQIPMNHWGGADEVADCGGVVMLGRRVVRQRSRDAG